MVLSFAKQTAVVTGAASGIGRATALAFGLADARVMVADLNEQEGRHTVEMLKKIGAEAAFVRVDLSIAEDAKRLLNETIAYFGEPDCWINNAGISGPLTDTANISESDWRRVLAVNLDSVFFCMQAVLPCMLAKKKGAIVNVASVAGLRGLPAAAAYTASKHGVVGLTRASAAEYAERGLRINAVCPVYTRTPMVEQLTQARPGLEERLKQLIPMKRFGEAEEVANTILWLCSDAAGFITGQAIAVDGGLTAM